MVLLTSYLTCIHHIFTVHIDISSHWVDITSNIINLSSMLTFVDLRTLDIKHPESVTGQTVPIDKC